MVMRVDFWKLVKIKFDAVPFGSDFDNESPGRFGRGFLFFGVKAPYPDLFEQKLKEVFLIF
jgi:hypothetical protein